MMNWSANRAPGLPQFHVRDSLECLPVHPVRGCTCSMQRIRRSPKWSVRGFASSFLRFSCITPGSDAPRLLHPKNERFSIRLRRATVVFGVFLQGLFHLQSIEHLPEETLASTCLLRKVPRYPAYVLLLPLGIADLE